LAHLSFSSNPIRQDIGEQRSYEKACQALREGAPDVRRKLAAKEVAAAALCSISNNGYGSQIMGYGSSSSDYLEDRDEAPCRHDAEDERE
jgi:hypothetical protein